MTDSTALPKWSSYREAILPIDLSSVNETEVPCTPAYNGVGYWEVESKTVRAELECEKLPQGSPSDALALPFTNNSNGICRDGGFYLRGEASFWQFTRIT